MESTSHGLLFGLLLGPRSPPAGTQSGEEHRGIGAERHESAGGKRWIHRMRCSEVICVVEVIAALNLSCASGSVPTY